MTAALIWAFPLLAQNAVQIENMRAGSPDWVRLNPAANREIEGFASATSVNRGETIRLFVSTSEPSYMISIYRTGWYNGAGARKVLGPITRPGTLQTTPAAEAATGLIECQWVDPFPVATSNPSDPNDWQSGVYVAKLTAGTSGKESYIVFVVRDDARLSTHYFQSSVTTYQAYNEWGGKSLYAFNSTNGVPAHKVSFNRPYLHGGGTGDYLLRWEYNMVRFLEREGYDVSYCTDIDTHRRGMLIGNHHDLLIIGHDEYWSNEMRANVTAARDAGVNLGFFSANDCYWQIRLEPSAINVNDSDRTIVAYKDAFAGDPYFTDQDPSNDGLVTNAWRFAPVSNSEDALIGVMYIADPVDTDIVIDDVTSTLWVFEATGLVSGSKLPGLLGYEVDKIQSRSPVPITRLGHSPFTTNKTNGNPNVSDVSDMTIYTAQSGALVFATGSIQFALGLDNWNANANGDRTSSAAQQMTRNILQRFAGTAAPQDCQYALSPSSANVTAASGSSTFTVKTFCSWIAASNDAWIHVAAPSPGSGSGTIAFTWDANTTTAVRTGYIHAGDRMFTLTQARSCSYSVSPASFDVDANGSTVTITITTDPGCFWSSSVSGSYSWITIAGPVSGSGNGTTTFVVAANDTTAVRNGVAAVAGQTVTFGQVARALRAMKSDFDGDQRSDIVLRNMQTGDIGMWLMNGVTIARAGCAGASPASQSIVGVGDFNGDGRSDILWRAASGGVGIWFMNGLSIQSGAFVGNVDPATVVAGIGDFNGDGKEDILWRDSSGGVGVWFMDGSSIVGGGFLGSATSSTVVAGVGDFDGDGRADILWRDDRGGIGMWMMNGASIIRGAYVGDAPATLTVGGIGDFDGDGRADILWVDAKNGVGFWLMNGATIAGSGYAGRADAQLHVTSVGDYNGDHHADILWSTDAGDVVMWFMNGAAVAGSRYVAGAGPGYAIR